MEDSKTFDELGVTLDCEVVEADEAIRVCSVVEANAIVLTSVDVIVDVIVDSPTGDGVGVGCTVLDVMVMWIVDVCAPWLDRRPGSKIMGSASTFCMLCCVTAAASERAGVGMVVMGIMIKAVEGCLSDWLGRAIRVGISGVGARDDENTGRLVANGGVGVAAMLLFVTRDANQ